MKTTELITRGVLADKDSVLLVRQKEAATAFLPGGHIAFGESAKAALLREIKEEVGITVEVKDFLGVVEHSWEDETGLNHEINLIFRIECEVLDLSKSPSSEESHLEFFWQPLDDLASVRLEPFALIELLPCWLRKKPKTGWGSTIE